MKNRKVVTKKVISPDGRVVAEAQSVIFTSGNDHIKSHQEVYVNHLSGKTQCHSSSSSSSTSSRLDT